MGKSEFKGSLTKSQIVNQAKGARGADGEGYRAEFIRLVEAFNEGETN